jgi:hypothetical protein
MKPVEDIERVGFRLSGKELSHRIGKLGSLGQRHRGNLVIEFQA